MSSEQLEDYIIDCSNKYGRIPAEDLANIFIRILKLIEQPLDNQRVVQSVVRTS